MTRYFSIKKVKSILALFLLCNIALISILIPTSKKIAYNIDARTTTDLVLGKVSTYWDLGTIDGNALAKDSNGQAYFTATLNYDYGIGINSDFLVGKVNATGELLWIQNGSLNSRDVANDIAIDIAKNAGYIVGETKIHGEELSESFISCFNLSNGNELWNLTFTHALYSTSGYSIITHNNLTYVAGVEEAIYPTYTTKNIFLACINETAHSLLWMKSCSNGLYDNYPIIKLNQMQDEIILVYSKHVNIHENNQFAIQKYDLAGNLTWSYLSDSIWQAEISDFVVMNSDSILMVGNCYESNTSSYRDIYVNIFNCSSTSYKEIIFGELLQNDFGKGIVITSLPDIFVTGYVDSKISFNEAAFLANLGLDGTVNWFRESYEYQYSVIRDLIIFDNDQMIAIGTAATNYDLFIKRLMICSVMDSDRDSLSDFWEPYIGTDPLKSDTDGDGFSDAEEHYASTDPLNPRSNPNRRKTLRNFGLVIFILLTIVFVVFQTYILIRQRRFPPSDDETYTQRFIKYCKIKFRKRKN
jgi:hypothetical protein